MSSHLRTTVTNAVDVLPANAARTECQFSKSGYYENLIEKHSAHSDALQRWRWCTRVLKPGCLEPAVRAVLLDAEIKKNPSCNESIVKLMIPSDESTLETF